MGSPQNAALRHRQSSIRAVIQSFETDLARASLETDLARASLFARPDIELLIGFFRDAEKNAKNEIELHELTHGGIDARRQACADPERYISNAPAPPIAIFDRRPPRPRRSREEMIASKRAELESELQKAEARSSELKKAIEDWYLLALPEWDRVTADARTRWTNSQRLAIEQYGALKVQHEQMPGSQATQLTTQSAPASAGAKGERWDKDIPADLIPAIKHLRESFEKVHWNFGWTTKNVCYWFLHESFTDEDVMPYAKDIGKLKNAIGPIAARHFDDLMRVGTLPAVFKAFYDFYLEGVSIQALYIFKHLLEIGRTHEQRLGVPHLNWATEQTKHLIRSEKHKIIMWVRDVCDKHVYDPHEDREEQIFWRKWQAPQLLIMKPSRYQPYDASRVWERSDAETSSSLLKSFQDDYVLHLEMKLEALAGSLAVELAKQPPEPAAVSSPKAAPDTPSPAEPSEAETKPRLGFSCSEDFRSVLFDGSNYVLTPAQSRMMKILWDAYQRGHPVADKQRLLAAVERETSQVRDTWRESGLWNKLIVTKKKGTYQLNLPQDTALTGSSLRTPGKYREDTA